MIKNKEEITVKTELNDSGEIKLHLHDLADFKGANPKLRMFSHAILNVGEEVEFHIHQGESESYYILSGKGLYNDNGEVTEITEGSVTFTASGKGHGIKNIGKEDLEFIALIILD